jgi:D-galactarolactone isomerase
MTSLLDDIPALKAPPGACDCHMHVFDARFPLAVTPASPPPVAPSSDYLRLRRALGLQRVVVVQPMGYRLANECTLDGMKAFGPGTRGVVIVPPEVSDAELRRLHDAGVRGVRYFLLPGGVLPVESMPAMAARIAPLGWNINLQLDGRELPRFESMLAKLACRLVIDHNGKFLEPVPPAHEGVRALVRLLERGNTYVKLSAPYETSRMGPPRYEDVGALARTYVAARPDRCLWATNWPHPWVKVVPSSAAMLDLLLGWAPDEETRRRILVDNPAVLYGFGPDERASG